ncbi:MAG: hypothetical protein AAB019_04965 [Planctomycetota bacterium]
MHPKLMMMGLAVGLWCYSGFFVAGQDEFKSTVDFKGSRLAVGYLDSGSQGNYPNGSYQTPEAKLRLNWLMAPDIKVVLRMNLNNATFKEIDYLYIDYTNLLAMISPNLKESFFNPMFRLGRFKLDIGEETWGNNAVEATTINPSATNTGSYDEGLQVSQILPKEKLGLPLKWSLSFSNGNAGTGADNQTNKSFCTKIGVNPVNELYISGSYYHSGELLTQNAEMTYAGLATPPTGATKWNRTITELDIRYDIQPGKENRLEPAAPAWSDSKAFFRFAYGRFNDEGKDDVAPLVQVTDRKGAYYFLEATYNLDKKIYLVGRYSVVSFNKSTTFASLNGVNANQYTRTSVGFGYRLSNQTHFKVDYTTNTEDVSAGVTEPENNQISALITTKF